MDFKNKNIESIIDSMYGFTLSLYSDGDNYLTSGYKLEDFNNKDEYNSLLNEYKDRIKIFLNQKKMKKIYENMTKKKYNKEKIASGVALALLVSNLLYYFYKKPLPDDMCIRLQDKLPECYNGGGESEWGERAVAKKHTKQFHKVLEFGGGAGSVSAIIQEQLSDKTRHVVIQPDERKVMMGGLKQLQKNKKACGFKFTIIDHILTPDDVQPIIKILGGKPDCLVVDCENCLVNEYDKNPELFDEVKMIQVERDDDGNYTNLFEKLGLVKIDQGYGCDGQCMTEVWEKPE